MHDTATTINNIISEDETNIKDDELVVRGVITKCASIICPDGSNVTVLRNGTREKNREFMDYYNYLTRDVAGILNRLKIWQYCCTSKKKGCDDAYCFGVTDKKLDIYIKFKFVANQTIVAITVLSFHDPAYKMTFPYIQFKQLECGKK